MPPVEKSKSGSIHTPNTKPVVPEKTFSYSNKSGVCQPVNSACGEATEGSKEKETPNLLEGDNSGHPPDEILGGDRFYEVQLDSDYIPPPLVNPSDAVLDEGSALLLKITEGVEAALNTSDKNVPGEDGSNSDELAADEAKKGRAARAKRKIKN